jgi:CRISP-associated protein Cas1
MTKRIIDITETSAFLNIRNNNLHIKKSEDNEISVNLEDIGVLVLSNPALTLTLPVLSELSNKGVMVVISDKKQLPCGMILPLQNNIVQSERFRKQASVALPLRKNLWKQIVCAKIKQQALLCENLYGNDNGLKILVKKVKSGDPENIEAQAARRYWSSIFQDLEFKRKDRKDFRNIMLNYGYMVLRAMTARALCAAGLHPSLGLAHHNRYDIFCFASDIMEPFRVLIDQTVVYLAKVKPFGFKGLTTKIKKQILSCLTGTVKANNKDITLFTALSQTANSLVEIYSGKKQKITFPAKICLKEKLSLE